MAVLETDECDSCNPCTGRACIFFKKYSLLHNLSSQVQKGVPNSNCWSLTIRMRTHISHFTPPRLHPLAPMGNTPPAFGAKQHVKQHCLNQKHNLLVTMLACVKALYISFNSSNHIVTSNQPFSYHDFGSNPPLQR